MAADAVVIGGGISGLTAAHRLEREGADVILIERAPRLGGIVETTKDDGFLVEGGPDSFVSAKGAVLELAAELGMGAEVISSNQDGQGSFVWWDGRLHPLPGGLLLMVPTRLGPLLRTSLLSWPGKLGALKDLVLPRSSPPGDETLGSFVRRRLGGEVLDRIAEPLIAGIHAADPETMSLRASFPRFLDMEAEHRSLILAARRMAARATTSGGLSHFASFRLGMGQLVSALEVALHRVDVKTGVHAVGLEDAAGGYRLVLDDGTAIAASTIVLAVPAPDAARLLGLVSSEAARVVAGIAQVSNLAVTLAYHTDQLPTLDGAGFVVPSAETARIRGVSYLSRKWAGRVPGPEFTLLRVFFPAGDDEPTPIEAARSELRTTIGVAAAPVHSWVRRHRQGLHRYSLGHLERVAQIERALRRRPGLALAGAGLYGVGLNECIRSGWAAAEQVIKSLGAEVS